jgi:hypothetical protein
MKSKDDDFREYDWKLRHRLSDLLDCYRNETACVTYNGWWKHQDPEQIRKEIDEILVELTVERR